MGKNNLLSQAFYWMFIGLLICFGVSYVATMNEDMAYLVYGSFGGYGYIIYAIVELVLVVVLSVRIKKMKESTAKLIYCLYTAFTGLSLGGIFFVYTKASIAFVFLATALVFGIFAFIGKKTTMDLSKVGTFLLIALLAIIIVEVINIFLMNSTLNMVLCIACIVIFAAYTAYDVNKALRISEAGGFNNAGIYIAFELFIDFINIFIRLLQLFGRRD